MAANDNGDPTLDYYGNQGQTQTQTTAPRQTGPVTDPKDPRLSDPSYASDPEVLKFINGIYGQGGTAQSQPAANSTWNPQTQAWETPTGGNGGAGSGDGSGSGNNGQGLFNPALYAPFTGQAPTYQGLNLPGFPMPQKPPAFSYQDFTAPTLEEASKQPGYQFGLQQGEQALQQSRAAQGLLRTGGTLKDILDYGRNAATQNYGNVLNQDLGIYNTNRAGAVQTYNTNYQTQYQDQYAPQLLKYQTEAASAQHQNDAQNNRAWDQYINDQNLFYTNQNAPFSKYLSLAQLGSANA